MISYAGQLFAQLLTNAGTMWEQQCSRTCHFDYVWNHEYSNVVKKSSSILETRDVYDDGAKLISSLYSFKPDFNNYDHDDYDGGDDDDIYYDEVSVCNEK